MAEDEWITLYDLNLEEAVPADPAAPRGEHDREDWAHSTNFEGRLPTLEEARNRVEGALLRTALHRCARNISMAAEELGVPRVTLYRLMDKFELRPGDSLRPGLARKGAFIPGR